MLKKHGICAERCRNVIIFVIILVLVLKMVSWLMVCSENAINPLDNKSGYAITHEQKDRIEVAVMGDSNVQCSVDPSSIWKDYGISSYVWGGANHRIYEIEHNLKQLFQTQHPKVVFIEANTLRSDTSAVNAMNQKVKADVASVFALVGDSRNIKNFTPEKLGTWSCQKRSQSKGYWLRTKVQSYSGQEWMYETTECTQIPAVAQRALKRCIEICRENNAVPVLMATVSPYEWKMEDYNAIKDLADQYGVSLLDLNQKIDALNIDWSQDTCDGGYHMNYRGARKISNYLGNYLKSELDLQDHRTDQNYAQWNEDCDVYMKC